MHCKACDVLLKENELGRKGKHTGEYIDLCDNCADTISEDIYFDYDEAHTDVEIDHDEDYLSEV